MPLGDVSISTEDLLGINAEINQFNVEEELPSFLHSVLDKAENLICADSRNVCGIYTHLVLDRTICILRLILQQVDEDDQEKWKLLVRCFEDISQNMQKHVTEMSLRPTTINSLRCVAEQTGRPPFHIQPEMLEDLLRLGFSKQKIGKLLGISTWTVYRRVRDDDLYLLSEFSDLLCIMELFIMFSN